MLLDTVTVHITERLVRDSTTNSSVANNRIKTPIFGFLFTGPAGKDGSVHLRAVPIHLAGRGETGGVPE